MLPQLILARYQVLLSNHSIEDIVCGVHYFIAKRIIKLVKRVGAKDGYKQSEIARHLKVLPTMVSKVFRGIK